MTFIFRVVPITTFWLFISFMKPPSPISLGSFKSIQAFTVKHLIPCVRTRIKNETHTVMLQRAEKSQSWVEAFLQCSHSVCMRCYYSIGTDCTSRWRIATVATCMWIKPEVDEIAMGLYWKLVHTCTLLFGVQLRMTTKLRYLMTAYYTPNDGLTLTKYHLIKAKLDTCSYTTRSRIFNIKIIKRHYRTSWQVWC